MTTIYAYWDKTYDQLASPNTISTTRRGCGEKLIDLLGEEYALKLLTDGKLFITEIKVERVV